MPRLCISECFLGCKGGSERDGGIGKDIPGDPKQKKRETAAFPSHLVGARSTLLHVLVDIICKLG